MELESGVLLEEESGAGREGGGGCCCPSTENVQDGRKERSGMDRPLLGVERWEESVSALLLLLLLGSCSLLLLLLPALLLLLVSPSAESPLRLSSLNDGCGGVSSGADWRVKNAEVPRITSLKKGTARVGGASW